MGLFCSLSVLFPSPHCLPSWPSAGGSSPYQPGPAQGSVLFMGSFSLPLLLVFFLKDLKTLLIVTYVVHITMYFFASIELSLTVEKLFLPTTGTAGALFYLCPKCFTGCKYHRRQMRQHTYLKNCVIFFDQPAVHFLFCVPQLSLCCSQLQVLCLWTCFYVHGGCSPDRSSSSISKST